MIDPATRLLEPDVLEDPYPFYAWLREHAPVVRSSRAGVFVLSRYADVRAAFHHPDLRAPDPDELMARAKRIRARELLLRSIAMTDPPAHTRLRRAVSQAFTPGRVEDLRAATESTCDEILDSAIARMRDGEVVDLHTDVSNPVAMNVIAGLLDVPRADRAALAPLVRRVLVVTNPAATDEQLADADAASGQVEAYFADLMGRTGGLIAALASADLTGDELMTMIWTLWASGFETTAAAVDLSVLTMLRHPDQAGRLAGDTGDVGAFVAESLRYEPPNMLTGVFRIARRDVELGGVTIPAGSDVRMLPGSANRDPAAFPRPDEFLPDRDNSAALAFGHGTHYCLGAALARMQLAVVLPRLHRRCPTLGLAGTPERRRSLTLRAFDRLPVALTG